MSGRERTSFAFGNLNDNLVGRTPAKDTLPAAGAPKLPTAIPNKGPTTTQGRPTSTTRLTTKLPLTSRPAATSTPITVLTSKSAVAAPSSQPATLSSTASSVVPVSSSKSNIPGSTMASSAVHPSSSALTLSSASNSVLSGISTSFTSSIVGPQSSSAARPVSSSGSLTTSIPSVSESSNSILLPSSVFSSSTVSAQSVSPSASDLPALPDCDADCLAPEEQATPDLMADSDEEDDANPPLSKNATAAASSRELHFNLARRAVLSKRARRGNRRLNFPLIGLLTQLVVMNVCSQRFQATRDTAADATIAYTVNTFTFTNSMASDFGITESTTQNVLPSNVWASFSVEHVFEFQFMGRFFSDNPGYCQFVTANSPTFNAIVNMIDNMSNLGMRVVNIIGSADLGKPSLRLCPVERGQAAYVSSVAGNKFGITALEQGMIAPSKYSASFNNLNDAQAVGGREKIQNLLRCSGGVINYFNANAAVFKDTATQVHTELQRLDQGMANAFRAWLQKDLDGYSGKTQAIAAQLANNYEFQLDLRTPLQLTNGFNVAQMKLNIANAFPQIQTVNMLP
ncbi:hypothetical protein C8R43DRAFT_943284 [Mycena crocata]|nr:hypothetical protein C8R43DRAFT_943284 [Mycena crocata]